MLDVKKYKLNKKVNEKNLQANGFKHCVLKRLVYKNLIEFEIQLDLENYTWSYEVIDLNINSYYSAYYNRGFGTNKVLETVDTKITEIMSELVSQKVFQVKPTKKEKK